MRLFLAVNFDPQYFSLIQDSVKKIDYLRAKFVGTFHLTLLFLGDCDPEIIKEKIKGIYFEPFVLRTSKVGYFSPNSIRVIWIGFEDCPELFSLQKQIVNLLDFKEDKKFHPHVTLCRVKNSFDSKLFKTALDSVSIELNEFKVKSISLMSSELTPEGLFMRKFFEYLLSLCRNPSFPIVFHWLELTHSGKVSSVAFYRVSDSNINIY